MSENLGQETAAPPPAAFEWFTGLAALGFVGMSAFVFAYGLLGTSMTAGLDSACAEAAFNSGKKLEALGNYDQAIQRYRQAMEGRFQSPEQKYMCGRSIGDLLFQQNRYSEAIEAYRALPDGAFSESGSFPGYVNALRMERRFGEARTLGLRWLEQADKEGDALQSLWSRHALMRIAGEMGERGAVLEYGNYLVQHDKSSDAHIVLARHYAAAGDPEKAVELLSTFVQNSNDARLRDQARKLLRELDKSGAQ